MTALTQEQAAKLLTSLMNAPLKYRTAIVILLYTGMRRSELCGIGWNDIDYENKRINLNKTVKYLPEKGTFIDEMKNESSCRWVPMTDSIATLLKEYHKEYLQLRGNLGDRWEETGMVFTNTTGGLLNPCTLYSLFKAFLRKNNLADVSLHALRHTTATLLIGEGVDVVTTASILGHADKSTTFRIYADAIKSKKHEAVEMLENLIDAGV